MFGSGLDLDLDLDLTLAENSFKVSIFQTLTHTT